MLLKLLILLPASQFNPLLNRNLRPCCHYLWQEHYHHLSSIFNSQMIFEALVYLIFHSLSLTMISYLCCQIFQILKSFKTYWFVELDNFILLSTKWKFFLIKSSFLSFKISIIQFTALNIVWITILSQLPISVKNSVEISQ